MSYAAAWDRQSLASPAWGTLGWTLRDLGEKLLSTSSYIKKIQIFELLDILIESVLF